MVKEKADRFVPRSIIGALLALLVTTLVGRFFENPIEQTRVDRISGVERIWVHLPGEFSIVVRGEDGVLTTLDLTRGGLGPRERYKGRSFSAEVINTKVVVVPPDAPLYAEVRALPRRWWDVQKAEATLYVHGVEDLAGAGFFYKRGSPPHDLAVGITSIFR
ncbi:MAG: hypothetical protein KBD16_02410 [Candidatus Pacebacteria bacterium]|nr:hypothetical protein [Candidatus Paceibacterota bacterium]